MENRCFVSLAKETCRIFMFQLQIVKLCVFLGQSWLCQFVCSVLFCSVLQQNSSLILR